MKRHSSTKQRQHVPPPLSDAASKVIFASAPFMARILKDCVGELALYSQQEIMELCQKANIHFASVPVHDQQATGEILAGQTNKRRITIDNMSSASSVEDTSVSEGAVHFDLLIELTIPMPDGDHIAVAVNVEIQNDSDNVCRIIKRGIYYCSRLISRQKNRTFKAPKYENIRKVYSIWLLAAADELLANSIRRFSLKEQIITAPQSKMPSLPTAYYDMMEVVIAGIDGNYMPLGKPNVLELLWLLSAVKIDHAKAKQYLQEVFKMDVTETMDTEIHNVRESLRRFYGNQHIAEMDEEIKQKAEERAIQIAEQKAIQLAEQKAIQIAEQRAVQIAKQKVEETVQKLEAKQKRETKRECKKAFKAGEESGFKAGEESGFKAGEESGFKAGEESGFKSGEERTTISVVTRMFNNGFTVKSIMSACDLSEQDVIAIRDHGCLPQH